MATMESETRTFSRDEFYAFVWSQPATKLAKELGCSDVMIGKVCKSYDIPKPYPGYWAKRANGKNPDVTPLPATDNPDLHSLTFFKYPECETTLNEPPRELQYDLDIREILEKAKRLEPVTVAKALRNPHRLVSVTRDDAAKRNAEAHLPGCEQTYWRSPSPPTLSIDVSKESSNRAFRIMDALIKRIEKIGGKIEIRKSGYDNRVESTVVLIADEVITRLRLREKHKQVRKSNKGAKYEWERNRTELVPTGLLLFDRGPSSYDRELLKDGAKKKIEDGLNEMIIELVKKAGEMRIDRREQEERRRRKEEAARIQQEREDELRRRKEELEARKGKEKARVDELFNHANSWRQSQVVREYLDAVCAAYTATDGTVPIDSELAKYLRWGFNQADRLDPLRECPASVLDETIDESTEVEAGVPRKPR